jgi:predicted nucleic acid-binding protein
LTELPIANATGHRYAGLMERLDRQGAPLPALDGFIAAAALENGARVATRNLADFARVPRLHVLNPG